MMIKLIRKHVLVLFFSTVILTTGFAQHHTPVQIEIEPAESGQIISRHIYGHFAEHLGRGIYDGFWSRSESGEISIRQDIVDALKHIQVPNLRWPGGCFADYYFWKDGIGDPTERPSIVNNLWGGVTEDNSVGTHEFMKLVRLLDTEPIVVGNVGSGTVQEMAQWWEYMNHPGPSPMADLRKKNGDPEPFNVSFWGVGNESWGCGGNMRPEFYADQYRRFATFLHGYPNVRPFRIAAGAAGSDYHWTEVLMREAGSMMDGLDLHHYTIIGSWETHKGHATDYTRDEWVELMVSTMEWRELLKNHTAIMDKYDPEKRVWLILGEWGTWHEPEEGSTPGFLYQQNTIRDALTASVSLDMFHRHLDRVKMANIAQTINVLQAMILTKGDQMILTPTYHVFDFYKVHHDAQYIDSHIKNNLYLDDDKIAPVISLSSSKDRKGRVNITISNIHYETDVPVEISLDTRNLGSITNSRILHGKTITDHNTFDRPNVVSPEGFTGAEISGSKIKLTIPARSLILLTVE